MQPRYWLAVVVVACLSSFVVAQDCYIDANGRQVCPLKKAAAATGKVLNAAANIVTPNSVPLPMQPYQAYVEPQATVQSSPSHGWSKSWHKVHGQPLRNIGRRLLGK